MKLYEYLIALLSAQAHTLNQMCELLSEDVLVEVLEAAGERAEAEAEKRAKQSGEDGGQSPGLTFASRRLDQHWFRDAPASESDPGFAYEEIRLSVQKMRMRERLEFHLWAYAPYRTLIESSLDLDSTITDSALVEFTLDHSKHWFKSLQLPTLIQQSVEQLTRGTWKRFQTELQERIQQTQLKPNVH